MAGWIHNTSFIYARVRASAYALARASAHAPALGSARARGGTLTRRFRFLAAACVLVAAAVLPAMTPLFAASAQAVIPIGPGYQIPNPDRPTMIGGYLAPDGAVLYCLQWGAQSPTGPNDTVLSTTQTNTYSDWSHLEIARVNYIISKWGQTTSNDQAAAVQMAIWMRHPGVTDPFFSEHRFVKATIRDDATRARIAAHARAMSSEADKFTPRSRAALGALELVPDAENPFAGEVRVSGLPEETLGTVTLEGAIFDTTQTNSAAGVHNGDVLRYTAALRDSDIGSYVMSADATFVTAGSPADELIVWRTPDGFQDLGQASSLIPDFQFALSSEIEVAIPFEPELSTVAVSSLVQTGEPLRDSISFSLAEGSLPWRQFSDGTFVAIDAWCQAYGPLDEQPETTAEAPSDAPMFGKPVVVTVGGDAQNPLESPVVAEVAELPTQEGHYTFVCGISSERQAQTDAVAALPTEYSFQHEYGLPEETALVAAPLAQTGESGSSLVVGALSGVATAIGLIILLGQKHPATSRQSALKHL